VWANVEAAANGGFFIFGGAARRNKKKQITTGKFLCENLRQFARDYSAEPAASH
jgi:hypothetical protein